MSVVLSVAVGALLLGGALGRAIALVAGAALVVLGCGADTANIPCLGPSNCPGAMRCDETRGVCVQALAWTDGHGDAGGARDRSADRPADRPADPVDGRADTLARADAPRADVRADVLPPADAWTSCAAACVARSCCTSSAAGCNTAWCGAGCPAVLWGCTAQCTSDSECCEGTCIGGACYSTRGGPCLPGTSSGCAPGLVCVGAAFCPGGSGCGCSGASSVATWGTCE